MSGWIVRPAVVLLLSTAVGAGQERSGVLRVTLDETTCRAVDEIGTYRVTTQPNASGGRNIGKTQIGQVVVNADCVWTIGDLAPGEYEVWFQHAGMKLAVRPLTIAAGERAEVALTNDVVVTGAVLMNGAPFRGVAVEFSQQLGSHRQLAETVTDATGNYQALLADEGPFTVVFWREKAVVLGQDQEGTAHRGVNRSDWLLDGGTLKVMPAGWDHKEPILLLIERKGARPRTRRVLGVGVQADADRLPLTLVGLAFGTYEMRWMTEDHPVPVSETVTVTIDAENREPSLELAVVAPQSR